MTFKLELKKLINKNSKSKAICLGSNCGCGLLTRIRVDRLDLNLHKFTVGPAEHICHAKQKNTKHYFLDFVYYTAEQQILFILVEHYILPTLYI